MVSRPLMKRSWTNERDREEQTQRKAPAHMGSEGASQPNRLEGHFLSSRSVWRPFDVQAVLKMKNPGQGSGRGEVV
jgi:hypothetical protein